MTDSLTVPAIAATNNTKNAYNAVKIRIEEPTLNLPNNDKNVSNIDGDFNAVDIEINKPNVDNKKCIYDYPENKDVVTAKNIDLITTPTMPVAPATFLTNNYNHNKVYVNANIDATRKETNNKPEIPAPNYTTLQDEKIDNKLSFRGLQDDKVQIVAAKKSDNLTNVDKVVDNLKSENYDTQAKEIANIAKVAFTEPKEALNYIVPSVLTELIAIVDKDNSELEKPDKNKSDIRKKIILNEIVKAKAQAEGKKLDKLPYEITKEELAKAIELSPFELAERNKEYAMYTVAALDKIYVDEVQKQTGNVIPITDLPGIANITENLKSNTNPSIKLAAMDSLAYIYRPEYKDEIKALFATLAQDDNKMVAQSAIAALNNMQ